MCERKCFCQVCIYCKQHERYLREKPLRVHRARIRQLNERFLFEDSMLVLDDFIMGRMSLKELELVLDAN